ncbi:MAG: hypothetical protein JNJ83_16855, partial [Verrucomicrobiaceae bacterium]|nr:hypothetical protein [Verrucomicrobiaceae bacterium]
MQQHWNIRSRAHQCAVTERPFEDGEAHHTAIYFDTKAGEFTRRDVSNEAWEQEIAERKPFSHWKSVYQKNAPEAKPEMVPKESAMALLQRLIDENESYTENARYILAVMLERKRILSPTATKENDEGHKLLFYENKKTGDVFIVRDPELRLDEVASVQEEVATLLGFGNAQPLPAKTPEPAPESAPAATDASEQPVAQTDTAEETTSSDDAESESDAADEDLEEGALEEDLDEDEEDLDEDEEVLDEDEEVLDEDEEVLDEDEEVLDEDEEVLDEDEEVLDE